MNVISGWNAAPFTRKFTRPTQGKLIEYFSIENSRLQILDARNLWSWVSMNRTHELCKTTEELNWGSIHLQVFTKNSSLISKWPLNGHRFNSSLKFCMSVWRGSCCEIANYAFQWAPDSWKRPPALCTRRSTAKLWNSGVPTLKWQPWIELDLIWSQSQPWAISYGPHHNDSSQHWVLLG